MDELQREIEEYRTAHWDEIVSDIEALVNVASVEDLAAATENAPYGPGPRKALDVALGVATRLGLDAHDCEGRIGYADLPGEANPASAPGEADPAGAPGEANPVGAPGGSSLTGAPDTSDVPDDSGQSSVPGTPDAPGLAGALDTSDAPGAPTTRQIGIIGHVDVVPAGPGWTVEPYAVTRRDGYLLGRGVVDDKGPLMVALHAVKFWKDRCDATGEKLPFTIRVLFGANEETNMKDVAFYREHFDDPDFLFTPDSQFPVGYGESGICSGELTSAPGLLASIREIAGGQAVNAVPGEASALVENRETGARKRYEAHGTSAHASTPELGENAIGILVEDLLSNAPLSDEERRFLELLAELHADTSGAQMGIACADEHFGALSMVGGVIGVKDGRICQSIDFRYPTAITADEIAEHVNAWAARAGASFTMQHDKSPFLMNPDSPEIRALLDAYCLVTGEKAKGLTSKGGTYARCFTTGVSFGVEKPWEHDPDWVGGMHGPDEGVSEALLQQAFDVYARSLGNLQSCR